MADWNALSKNLNNIKQWNEWRSKDRSIRPDLRRAELIESDLTGADLSGANLSGAFLSGAVLRRADLSEANLIEADLRRADLSEANLIKADLRGANLSGARRRSAVTVECGAVLRRADLSEANLSEADLRGANLRGAVLSQADLRGANLSGADVTGADLSEANLTGADLDRAILRDARLTSAILIHTNLDRADLSGASIFGISVWDISLEGTTQKNLIVQRSEADSPITLDDLEVAQFVYLLLNNKRIRNVIDTITSKVVLILGRFTPERKPILNALREELRGRNYLPILFDFEKPSRRDMTETVSTLAHMARFVIADLTDAKSLPQELTRIVPILPSVPVQPILLASEREWAMYDDLTSYPWVLPTARYESKESLLAGLQSEIIDPAEKMASAQAEWRRRPLAR